MTTAVQVSVTTTIDGNVFELPPTAKYVTQHKNGLWFWMEQDPTQTSTPEAKRCKWTPTIQPIMSKSADGKFQLVRTSPPLNDAGLIVTKVRKLDS
jgi:hypothetical protein